jgi:glycosyltransferase involved in cell wall biosynthesis
VTAISPNDVTLVALIVGDRASYATRAKEFLNALNYFVSRDAPHEMRIVIVVDGQAWQDALQSDLQAILHAQIIVMPTETNLPGRMMNAALAEIKTAACGVLSICAEVSTWFANRAALCLGLGAGLSNNTQMVAGYRGSGEARTASNESYLVHQDDHFSSDYPYAWLQMLDLVPMTNALMCVDLLRRVGGFSEAPSLQRLWWWEFSLRVSRDHHIASLPLQPVPGLSWHQMDFTADVSTPVDGALNLLMQIFGEPKRLLPAREDELEAVAVASEASNIAKDKHWRGLSGDLRLALCEKVNEKKRPLRIAVLGGVNEPAHNQLCFFNYFSLMRDWRVLTWRSFLDERATIDELAGYDLVIFSRVRSEHGAALMAACAAKKIRTVYMLDDNWFWLGREWHDYADIFAPGKAPYENFLSCVKNADTTLTYSAPLAEDLRPYAKQVELLPTNVNLALFPQRPITKKTTIGYVGSLRKNMVAFDALVNVAIKRSDVSIFIMSNSLPPEFSAIPASRIHFEPYQFNYAGYAATVTAAAPDILVAPVGRSRFEESKCPNKFLEITAARAAGVYTRAEPYLSHVVESQTGLFADDTPQSWTSAIERLLDAPALRQQITENAYQTVSQNYSTRAVLPQFIRMLLRSLG